MIIIDLVHSNCHFFSPVSKSDVIDAKGPSVSYYWLPPHTRSKVLYPYRSGLTRSFCFTHKYVNSQRKFELTINPDKVFSHTKVDNESIQNDVRPELSQHGRQAVNDCEVGQLKQKKMNRHAQTRPTLHFSDQDFQNVRVLSGKHEHIPGWLQFAISLKKPKFLGFISF